jgi:hypothetical protein
MDQTETIALNLALIQSSKSVKRARKYTCINAVCQVIGPDPDVKRIFFEPFLGIWGFIPSVYLLTVQNTPYRNLIDTSIELRSKWFAGTTEDIRTDLASRRTNHYYYCLTAKATEEELRKIKVCHKYGLIGLVKDIAAYCKKGDLELSCKDIGELNTEPPEMVNAGKFDELRDKLSKLLEMKPGKAKESKLVKFFSLKARIFFAELFWTLGKDPKSVTVSLLKKLAAAGIDIQFPVNVKLEDVGDYVGLNIFHISCLLRSKYLLQVCIETGFDPNRNARLLGSKEGEIQVFSALDLLLASPRYVTLKEDEASFKECVEFLFKNGMNKVTYINPKFSIYGMQISRFRKDIPKLLTRSEYIRNIWLSCENHSLFKIRCGWTPLA